MRSGTAAAVIVAAAIGCAAADARAQEGIFGNMQKGIEITSSSASTTTTFSSGLVTRTESQNLYPRFTLNIDTLLYPSLRLNTGGVFELNLLTINTDSVENQSTILRNRPFVLLRSTNPVFSPGFGYFRREDRSRTAGLANTKLVNDELAGYLGWHPPGGPRSDLQVIRSHTFDGALSLQDQMKHYATLVSSYTYKDFGAYYQGSYANLDDRLHGLDTRQTTHGGRVSGTATWLQKRLVWNGTYNVNYQGLALRSNGTGGDVDVPVTAFAGLSATSDLPETARLSPNPLLIDGGLTASAGIDIGLAVPPDDTQSRNIGLDFLNPARVNRLLVWIDRELPPEITSTYSWQVYTSIDNITWTRTTVVSAAPFGPFENRFEIVFPVVTARYLKLVVRPLSIAAPDASRYSDIFVTELQAFLRRAPGELADRSSQTIHVVNTDARMRLLDAPALFYEGFFLYDGPDTFGRSTRTLSNGLSANQRFTRYLSAYGRGAYEQGHDPRGERTAIVTSGSLTADPIPTFRSSLLYSGEDERIVGVPSNRHGVFLQNSAQLYRGVNALFGIGWSVNNRDTGEVSHDRLVNASATVVPRQHISFTVSFDQTATTRSGAFTGLPQTDARRLYAAVAFDPLRALHLVLGEEVLAVTGQRTRTTHNIGANWSPFPDGTLQFVFAYNEALRPIEFGSDRSTLGSVRWNVSRRSYFDVTYQRTLSEIVFQRTESRIFSLSLRLFA